MTETEILKCVYRPWVCFWDRSRWEKVSARESEACAQEIKLDGLFWGTSSEVRASVWSEGDASILLKYES